MLYAIVLTYTRPIQEVNQQLDSHKEWLHLNLLQGRVIFAGPLEPRTGGLILAACNDQAELEALMSQDAFITHQVAQYQAFACAPGLACADFPAKWAPGAHVYREPLRCRKHVILRCGPGPQNCTG